MSGCTLALDPKDEHFFMEMTESGMCESFTLTTTELTTTDMVSLPGSFADAAIVPMVQRAKFRFSDTVTEEWYIWLPIQAA
jgi:hypothetical protein